MSKENGITFEFDLNAMTVGDMEEFIAMSNLRLVREGLTHVVIGCNQTIGPLDKPETYKSLKWGQLKDLMRQLGEAAKNDNS